MDVRTWPLSLRSFAQFMSTISSPWKKMQFNTCRILQGNSVTQKTTHKILSMAHDQVHEQINAIMKGDGVIIGITENEAVLTLWTVDSPETTRFLMEYDENHSLKRKDTDHDHEQIPSVQKTYCIYLSKYAFFVFLYFLQLFPTDQRHFSVSWGITLNRLQQPKFWILSGTFRIVIYNRGPSRYSHRALGVYHIFNLLIWENRHSLSLFSIS